MIEQLLTPVIVGGGGCPPDLIPRYMRSLTARDRFLRGEISFEDYLDILESLEVAIDQYLDCVDQSLEVLGVD